MPHYDPQLSAVLALLETQIAINALVCAMKEDGLVTKSQFDESWRLKHIFFDAYEEAGFGTAEHMEKQRREFEEMMEKGEKKLFFRGRTVVELERKGDGRNPVEEEEDQELGRMREGIRRIIKMEEQSGAFEIKEGKEEAGKTIKKEEGGLKLQILKAVRKAFADEGGEEESSDMEIEGDKEVKS